MPAGASAEVYQGTEEDFCPSTKLSAGNAQTPARARRATGLWLPARSRPHGEGSSGECVTVNLGVLKPTSARRLSAVSWRAARARRPGKFRRCRRSGPTVVPAALPEGCPLPGTAGGQSEVWLWVRISNSR